MTVTKVVVGYDGSDGSRSALNWTVRRARRPLLTLHLVQTMFDDDLHVVGLGQLAIIEDPELAVAAQT
jgi:Universal stress protein family